MPLPVGEWLGVPLVVTVRLGLWLGVLVSVGLSLGVCVGEGVGVLEALALAEEDTLPVPVLEAVGVSVPPAAPPLRPPLGLPVELREAELQALPEAVAVGAMPVALPEEEALLQVVTVGLLLPPPAAAVSVGEMVTRVEIVAEGKPEEE